MFRPLTPALLTCICFAFSFRAYLSHSCAPLFLLTHPFSPHVSHVFTFYINNLVPLSFALQNMDVAKASERLLKLAVSMHIYLCIRVQIYKRVPGVSEIRCKSTIFKALSWGKSMKASSEMSNIVLKLKWLNIYYFCIHTFSKRDMNVIL